MYAREGAPLTIDESAYDDVDARTIQRLQADLAKRSQAKGSSEGSPVDAVQLQPELVR
jgi:hypothetical protein